MKIRVLLALLSFVVPGIAQDKTPPPSEEEMKAKLEAWVNGLKFQTGKISLPGGIASLNVPAEFKYLNSADSVKLMQVYGNPPQEMLGIIFPAAAELLKDEDGWFVVIQFSEDGHVKDDDAEKINYDDLLKQMKEGAATDSAERIKQGYSAIELVGWAAKPHYDKETHKLYWAKEIKFAGEASNTLNYNIRMLGRKGVLVANAVSSISKLPEIESATPQILAMVDFNEGHRYADFDEKKGDKVATYGIAGLIAAGIAAKAGLFKVIGIFLLKFWKLLAIGVVAVGAWIKKIFTRPGTQA